MASVAATLTGLVFVAVSINLNRIISMPGLSGRSAESLLQLLGVVILSTLVLIPGAGLRSIGLAVLGLALLSWLLQTALQVRYVATRAAGDPLWWLVSRVLQTQASTIPFLIGAAYLFHFDSTGIYWFALGFALSLASGVLGAWVLLIEIMR